MGTKTLAELAALAMVHVPNFARPYVACRCGSVCRACKGLKALWNDTPEALLMAVELCVVKGDHVYRIDNSVVMVTTYKATGAVPSPMQVTPEGIARAAIEALLRAHGSEP